MNFCIFLPNVAKILKLYSALTTKDDLIHGYPSRSVLGETRKIVWEKAYSYIFMIKLVHP